MIRNPTDLVHGCVVVMCAYLCVLQFLLVSGVRGKAHTNTQITVGERTKALMMQLGMMGP